MGIARAKEHGDKCRAWKGRTVKRICLKCDKEFSVPMAWIKKGGGIYCSNECRRLGKSDQMQGETNPMYGKVTHSTGSWFVLANGSKMWLRSSYEVRALRALVALKVQWEYEPKAFPLNGTGKSYRPDFLINNRLWWEVKGYMRSDARTRMEKFAELYPSEVIKIITIDDIKILESEIANGNEFDIESLGKTWAE